MQIHQTTLEVIQGDLLAQDVEAIVNAANTAMQGGGGISEAFHGIRETVRSLMENYADNTPKEVDQ